MALLPVAVSPHGRLGGLFERFLYGKDPLPMPDYVEDRIHAAAALSCTRPFSLVEKIYVFGRPKDLSGTCP